jgi:hypothetical protein
MLRSSTAANRLEVYKSHQHHDSEEHGANSQVSDCHEHREEMRIAETILLMQKKRMLDMLSLFREESGELRRLKEERNSE